MGAQDSILDTLSPSPAPSPADLGHLEGPCDFELVSWLLGVVIVFVITGGVLDKMQRTASSSGKLFVCVFGCAVVLPTIALGFLAEYLGNANQDAHAICRLTGVTLCRMFPLAYMFCLGAVLMLFVQTIDPAERKVILPLVASRSKRDEGLLNDDSERHS